ncbi:hypothetical protein ABTZ58_39470 [Streptomyces sp. NPDC094143]|uniref:hypothetical protein n=1 Tax=Streptomyces sp. NPDC094143 TaxID=3155310 RepID=UPI0033174064
MSAVAASAAVLPRTKFAGEASRRRLRSVPAQAGPAVPPKLGNPLQLGKSMRARLLAAVRALVTSPALAGASDGARLASVVLTAKSNVANDYQASIWAAELGRWLGVSQSTVAHTVLPELRAAGFLGSNVATNSFGHATGLECWVIPMYRAQKAGDRRHPLALSRSELAVLLSLCEVLFGPGWAPKDKAPVPAGLLAGRRGRGAATDRLGLLLMVLTTGSAGWLQLCPGSVDTGRGRPAATVGRLLGCTAAAGAKVLKRLQEHGVAEVVRKETGSGLNAQSRVRLVPVVEAHGVAVREARRVAKALISDLAGTASGDLESGETGEALVTTGIEGAEQDGMAGSANLAVTAQHHASHASGVTPGGSLALSGGFSGEGRGAEGRRPERACVREDQAADGQAAVGKSAAPVAEDGPLRGEKPQESPVNQRAGRCAAGAVAGGRLKAVGGGKAQQQRRIGLPADLGLRVALGPVAGLWERLSGWQQDQVEAAVKAEVKRLAGMLERPERAPQLLADRFTDRLEETGGEALVDRPFPWLIRRGLAQRQACSDPRCDDGIRLDTGGECENCNNVLHIRRAQRAKIAAEVDRELPGLGGRERRQVLEERLREHTQREAEQAGARHDQVVAEVEMRRAAAARRRAAEEAAALQRRAAACVECGLPGAAGLCPECTYRRCTDALVQEAVDLAVAVRADLDDPAQIAALSERCEADTRALLDDVCRRQTATDQGLLAFTAREVAERIRDERRASAHSRLLRSEEAEAEAEAVYDTVLRRRPRGHQAAEEAAEEARRRTAHYLLERKLGLLRAQRARMQAGRAPKRVG